MDTGLYFYWDGIKPDEKLPRWAQVIVDKPDEKLRRWAQVIVATHRLRFVCDKLTESATEPDIENALEHLAYHAENYLVRVYELRERVVKLLEMLSGASSGALKNPKTRKPAIANVRKILPKVASPLDRLLAALDDDIEFRNTHTHDTFLRIGLWTEKRFYYDSADALVELDGRPKASKHLEALLRKGAKRLAREYERKADRVIRLAMALVKIGPSRRLRPRSAIQTGV
jgi:hypothetical protein